MEKWIGGMRNPRDFLHAAQHPLTTRCTFLGWLPAVMLEALSQSSLRPQQFQSKSRMYVLIPFVGPLATALISVPRRLPPGRRPLPQIYESQTKPATLNVSFPDSLRVSRGVSVALDRTWKPMRLPRGTECGRSRASVVGVEKNNPTSCFVRSHIPILFLRRKWSSCLLQ